MQDNCEAIAQDFALYLSGLVETGSWGWAAIKHSWRNAPLVL